MTTTRPTPPLEDLLDPSDSILPVLWKLNDAMVVAYRACVEKTKQHSRGPRDEHACRLGILQQIDQHLEYRPLTSFNSYHLDFLETLIAYWRELEIIAGAPTPDPVSHAELATLTVPSPITPDTSSSNLN